MAASSSRGSQPGRSSEGSEITRRSLLGNAAALVTGAMIGGSKSGRAIAELAQPGGGTGPVPPPSLATDRWLEIDLYWFRQKDLDESARLFWKRFLPLFTRIEGYRGVILNVAWTVGPIMEWSGDLSQRVSVHSGSVLSLEQPLQGWIEEKAPLPGTTEERKREWAARFAQSGSLKRRPVDLWTYVDLKKLAGALKQTADRNGVSGLKVGMFNTGGTGGYGEESAWVRRHPEAFSPLGKYFDPNAVLHADSSSLGGLPNGILEGMPVHDAYAAQWGSLSRAVGFDAILLRDNIGMPVAYRRGGPWGPVAPSPEVIQKATEGVATLVRKAKLANPEALVMMYSNGASAISDWRSNGFDLESVAREGYLDIWIDQTWAGAWNEVGVRRKSFWNSPIQGWTYQLGYMLLHAATLAGTKVRHYPLIETFDAWEDWDVLHTVPKRLRWGIWAYSHAAVKTPQGLRMPAGSYISWGNQGERLLGEDDVRFLADNVNAAIADAHRTTQVFGPTLVYSRDAMKWQADHAQPDRDINEWIDEQAASVIKWPVPILSVTRVEWLPHVQSDLFVVQTPSHLAPSDIAYLARLIEKGQPVAIVGDPVHGVDSKLATLVGLAGSSQQEERPIQKYASETNPQLQIARNVPQRFNSVYRLTKTSASNEAEVVYRVDGNPELVLNCVAGKRVAMWDPPELLSRIPGKSPLVQIVMFDADGPVMVRLDGDMDLPLKQLWGNTGAPYALMAGVLNLLLSGAGALHAAEIDLDQTVNVAAWRTRDGSNRILAGNLEEGIREDADMSRHATLVLPKSWDVEGWQDTWRTGPVQHEDGQLRIDLAQAESVLLQAHKKR